MAVLRMAVLRFPGADAVLAAHGPALPQPDQLCGPFTAHLALHAVADRPPSVTALARAAGTAVWPEDVADWRPAGVESVTTGWDDLPRAGSPARSGTNALGVAAAVSDAGRAAVPVAGLPVDALASLLVALLDGPPVGVLANVDTGAMDPTGAFAVGHFVVLWGCSADGRVVGVADTYAELGAAGSPPGCREVTVEALHAGVSAPPGRGLLLLVDPGDASGVRQRVVALGGSTDLWST